MIITGGRRRRATLLAKAVDASSAGPPSAERTLVGRGHGFIDRSPDRCLRLKLAAVFVVQSPARSKGQQLIGSERPEVTLP